MRNVVGAILIGLFYSFIFAQVTSAAGTTIVVSPQSGTFDKEFKADIVIDGHGEKFNAAQATVALSYGLAVKDLTLGDCNFSFLTTPSAQDPSFAGVILSAHSTRCIVYTLTLIPTAKTNATISLSKASVRRYGDAKNILSTTTSGSYNLTATLKPPEVNDLQSANESKKGLYAVHIKTLSSQNSPVKDATVVLNAVSGKQKQQATTDKDAIAHFFNLQPGIYDAVVMINNSKAGEAIINVSGNNHVLTFGISLKNQKNNPLLKQSGTVLGAATSSPYLIPAILIVGILVGTGVSVLFIKFTRSRKMPV